MGGSELRCPGDTPLSGRQTRKSMGDLSVQDYPISGYLLMGVIGAALGCIVWAVAGPKMAMGDLFLV